MPKDAYHHGALRRALLDAAVERILEVGPSSLSLRDLSRRADVSHAAPAHHFGDKAGLFAALATEGFDLLADRLTASYAASHSVVEAGVTYVEFALGHPAHFQVMFRRDLFGADEEVARAGARAFGVLQTAVDELPTAQVGSDREVAAVAAWSLVHGFASLWIGGAFEAAPFAHDPRGASEAVAAFLFPALRTS